MSLLREKLHLPQDKKRLFRAVPILVTIALLIYYCVHPEMYSADGDATIWKSVRTYEIILLSTALVFLWLSTNELSDRVNRILSWVWFAAAPFAVYFSLLFLNADKFNIDFFCIG